jgi:mannose/cellobiose epimerase-like protein (N-acyl-D-glucosamine 2-epimerase family)
MARRYCIDVLAAVWEGRIYNDQVSFDLKNPITLVSGRRSHAPYMLMVPTVSLLYRHEPAEADRTEWFEEGVRLIQYVLNHHVNLPEGSSTRFPDLAPYDFLEYLDTEGKPYTTHLEAEECILCDPGHALEFVGLSTTFLTLRARSSLAHTSSPLSIRKGSPIHPSRLGTILYRVFQRNFQNGFREDRGGIVKLFDLKTRRAVNPDMPWWSLPETIRAAWGCRPWGKESVCMRVLSSCWNALVQNYIGNNPGDFCIQNRNQEGTVTPTIPAVPDVDPLYHTGLPLLTVWSK